jgi:hypothetical protein
VFLIENIGKEYLSKPKPSRVVELNKKKKNVVNIFIRI